MKQSPKITPLLISLTITMASNARCVLFLVLALCLSFQTHGRDSKFFNKLTRSTKEEKEESSVAAVQAPSPAPEPEPQVVEHGYGLYGQDPYEYPPTTTNPTKAPQEFTKKSNYKNGNENGYVSYSEKQGMSDTRFLENGKYFYDVSQDDVSKDESSFLDNGNQEKQGMSDTRFLENGKYWYDVNNDKQQSQSAHFNTNNNEDFEAEKQGMSDTRSLENGNYFYDVSNEVKGENADFNTNNNENNKNFEAEKQGMSDTRFLENGKYFYDLNKGENVHSNTNDESQGMSDTRYLEKGKYFYDVNNDKESNSNNNHVDEDVGFHSKDNIEYAKSYNGNEHETQERGGGGYNYPNKFPKYEYDTMEEYDRAQGYIHGKDHYVP